MLSGSRALAMPLSLWKGSLTKGGSGNDKHLAGLSQYLDEQHLFSESQRATFRDAVEEGLQFISDIPQGSGVGSSGALCAAVYDAFFADRRHTDHSVLRTVLSEMESCFHGKSSGMDPLVSYVQAPILREQESYHSLPPLAWPENLHLFLIDSGTVRQTGELVQQYMEWTRYEDFQLQCLRPLIESVNHAIGFLLEPSLATFWEHLHLISTLQFHHFKPMIPEYLRLPWKALLESDNARLKLCGAGGGGYFLLLSTTPQLPAELGGFEIIAVPPV